MGCSAGKTVFSCRNSRNESQVIPSHYITESASCVKVEVLEIVASHFTCWLPLWIDIDDCVVMTAWQERTDNLLSKIPSD